MPKTKRPRETWDEFQERELLPYNIRIIWDNDKDLELVKSRAALKRELLDSTGLDLPEKEEEFYGEIPKHERDSAVSEETDILSNEERAQAALGTKDKAQKLKDKAQQLKDKASQAIWISEIFEGILFNFNSHDEKPDPYSQLRMARGKHYMPKCEASWQFPKNLQPKGVLGLPIYEEDQILNKDDLAYFESKRLQMFDKAFWTSPILSEHNLCFPWGVYDAQKAVDEDSDKYMESHSRCSRGTAVCINLLEMMSEKVQLGSLQDIPPVLSFTSIGEKWSVFMAYRHEGGIRLSRIWNGDITNHRHALQLVHIVECAKRWALGSFRTWVTENLRLAEKLQEAGSLQSSCGSASATSTPSEQAVDNSSSTPHSNVSQDMMLSPPPSPSPFKHSELSQLMPSPSSSTSALTRPTSSQDMVPSPSPPTSSEITLLLPTSSQPAVLESLSPPCTPSRSQAMPLKSSPSHSTSSYVTQDSGYESAFHDENGIELTASQEKEKDEGKKLMVVHNEAVEKDEGEKLAVVQEEEVVMERSFFGICLGNFSCGVNCVSYSSGSKKKVRLTEFMVGRQHKRGEDGRRLTR